MKKITIPYRRTAGALGLQLHTIPESFYPIITGLKDVEKESSFYNLPLTSIGLPSSATEISREEIVNRVCIHMSPGAELISIAESSGASHSFISTQEVVDERFDSLVRLLGTGTGVLLQDEKDFKEFHFTLNMERYRKVEKRAHDVPPSLTIHKNEADVLLGEAHRMLKDVFQIQLKKWHKLVKGENNDDKDDDGKQAQGAVASSSTATPLTPVVDEHAQEKEKEKEKETVSASSSSASSSVSSMDMSVHFKPTSFERRLLKYVDADGLLNGKKAKQYLEIMAVDATSVDERALCLVGLSKVARPKRPELRRIMLETKVFLDEKKKRWWFV